MRGLRSVVAVLGFVFAAGCTGSDEGGASDPIDHLTVAPDGATIDSSTTVVLRATGVTESGRLVDVEDVSWTASAGSIAADGTFTPAGAGDVTVDAEARGKTGTATIHVVAPGSAEFLVVDATTSAPIGGAAITLVTSTSGVTTGGDGTATLAGAFSGAIDVTVRADDYVPMTIYGLKTKDVRVTLRPVDPPSAGLFSGSIDFTEAYDADQPEQGYLWVGIGGPAIKGNILAYGLESLLGPDREVTISGFNLNAPSNLYVHGFTPPYIASAPAGETVAFGLGGEVKFSTITDIVIGGTSDLGEVIAELLPIFNEFYYSVREGVNVPANGATLSGQDLVLTQKLSKKATLTVGDRPVTDPNPLVVAAVDFGPDIGFVPAGLNIVDGETEDTSEVRVPPLSGAFEDKSYVFLIVSQEGGLGTGGGEQQVAVLSRGHKSLGDIVTPDFLVPPAFTSFTGNGGTGTFDYGSTADADFVFNTFSRDLVVGTAVTATLQWDVLASGDSDGFVLPMTGTSSAAQAGGSWNVQTLGLQSQTYESLFTPGAPIDATSYFNDANRVVITNADVE